jgi:hypothetical protein
MKEPLLTLETRRIQCAQLDKHYLGLSGQGITACEKTQ